jgi:HD superfamily phosphohydrolase
MSQKRIYCPIHGFITLTDVMRQIIDTPEFQRLRDLKQLGAAYFVYPSATHSRFAHSLGVSHLAGEAAKSLQTNQPELKITDREIELFRIAGLIHDIGHGPFSHLYDDPLIRGNEPEHEERGCNMFREMVQTYKIPLTQKEVEKIIDMVDPKGLKQYLWYNQIVANKICQIDVDKIDYIRRDCYHLGLTYVNPKEFSRLVTDMRVCIVDSRPRKLMISWPKKLQYEIFTLFSTRYRLHREVYTHHTVRAYEMIIKEMLINIKKSEPHFTQLTDSVISQSSFNRSIDRFQKMIATRNIPKIVEGTKELVIKNRNTDMMQNINTVKANLEFDGYYIDQIRIGFVSGDLLNPLENVYYYTSHYKKSIPVSVKLNPYTSFMVPNQSFQDIILRLYKKSYKNIPEENFNVLSIEKVKKDWKILEMIVDINKKDT